MISSHTAALVNDRMADDSLPTGRSSGTSIPFPKDIRTMLDITLRAMDAANSLDIPYASVFSMQSGSSLLSEIWRYVLQITMAMDATAAAKIRTQASCRAFPDMVHAVTRLGISTRMSMEWYWHQSKTSGAPMMRNRVSKARSAMTTAVVQATTVLRNGLGSSFWTMSAARGWPQWGQNLIPASRDSSHMSHAIVSPQQ